MRKWTVCAAAAAFGAVLTGCGPQAASPAGDAGAAQQEAPAPIDERLSQNDPVTLDGVEVRVERVALYDTVGGQFVRERASDGGVLVGVEYTLKNVSSRPIGAFSMPDLHLLDSAGNRYSPDLGKSGAFAMDLNLDVKIMSDLNPGIRVRNAAVFEVGKEQFDPLTWSISIGGSKPLIAIKKAPPPTPVAAAEPAPETDGAPPVQVATAPPPPTMLAEPRPAAAPAGRGAAPPPLPARTALAAGPRAGIDMGQFAARERRLQGLLENAIARDVTGQVQRQHQAALATRARCGDTACVQASFAVEEGELSQWDGADELLAGGN